MEEQALENRVTFASGQDPVVRPTMKSKIGSTIGGIR
jgi:hypothetical protein